MPCTAALRWTGHCSGLLWQKPVRRDSNLRRWHCGYMTLQTDKKCLRGTSHGNVLHRMTSSCIWCGKILCLWSCLRPMDRGCIWLCCPRQSLRSRSQTPRHRWKHRISTIRWKCLTESLLKNPLTNLLKNPLKSLWEWWQWAVKATKKLPPFIPWQNGWRSPCATLRPVTGW